MQSTFIGNYFNNCGQSAETDTLNFHFLWHDDIQHGLFHFDSGILYTLKQLLTRPGNAIREFIEGKRVKHFNPFSLVIVLATLFGLLMHFFHIEVDHVITLGNPQNIQEINVKIQEWISTHYSWAILITLPFYTLASFIAFKRQGYNFAEHLVLNAFAAGQKLLVHINHILANLFIYLLFWLAVIRHKEFSFEMNKVDNVKFNSQTLLSSLIFLIIFIVTLVTERIQIIFWVLVISLLGKIIFDRYSKRRAIKQMIK